MARISIQPDSVENRYLIFFTKPQELIRDDAVDARIKRVVLKILQVIVNILTIGILAGCADNRRVVLEFAMKREMMESLPGNLRQILTNALTDLQVPVQTVSDGLEQIDGLSGNVKEYIISLLPVERLGFYTESEELAMTSELASSYIDKILQDLHWNVMSGRSSLENVEGLGIKSREQREDLFRGVDFFVNFDEGGSEIETDTDEVEETAATEVTSPEVVVEIAHPIAEVMKVLSDNWVAYKDAEDPSVTRDSLIHSLVGETGVSTGRAKSLVDFVSLFDDVEEQVVINNFGLISEESFKEGE